MLARLQRRNRNLRVAGVRRADAHRVHVRVGQQGFHTVVGLSAVTLRQFLRARRIQIIKRGELRVGVVRHIPGCDEPAQFAAANDTDMKHVFSSLSSPFPSFCSSTAPMTMMPLERLAQERRHADEVQQVVHHGQNQHTQHGTDHRAASAAHARAADDDRRNRVHFRIRCPRWRSPCCRYGAI